MNLTPSEVKDVLNAIAYPVKFTYPKTAEVMIYAVKTIEELLEKNTMLEAENAMLRKKVEGYNAGQRRGGN